MNSKILYNTYYRVKGFACIVSALHSEYLLKTLYIHQNQAVKHAQQQLFQPNGYSIWCKTEIHSRNNFHRAA